MSAKKTVRRPTGPQRSATSNPEIDDERDEDLTEEEQEDTEEGVDETPESDEDAPEQADPTKTPAEAATEPEHIPGAPRDGVTFKAGSPIYFKGEKKGNSVVVKETIYRASHFPGTDRWKFNLVMTAGTVLPASRAKKRDDGYFTSIDHN